MCPPITEIPNAKIYGSSNLYGSFVNVTCDLGYKLPSGSTVQHAHCLVNGRWSNSFKPCKS